MQFIEYSKCRTCTKYFLDDNNIDYIDRQIKEDTPTSKEIYTYKYNIQINKIFNTSGMVYKSLGLKDKIKNMSIDEKIKILSSDAILIKRPLLVCNDKMLIGFKQKEWKEYFKI